MIGMLLLFISLISEGPI